MSAKTSAARRAAFMAALRATGNQTIAAERAKVSSSWVQLHRSGDPDFRRESDAAIAEAKAMLKGSPGRRPPSGWGSLDGEELVVKGTNGRRTQIARARIKQWSPRVEDRFLATLAATCNVKASCAEVGLTQASAYGHREQWPGFARRWEQALETGYLKLECVLVMNACNVFSNEGIPVDVPITPPMRFDEAMQLLNMHRRQVLKLGKPKPIGQLKRDQALESILRKLKAVARGHAEIGEAELARTEREMARRRTPG